MKRTVPAVTLALSVATLLAWLTPGANAALQFERPALHHGELWRLLTGHFTHWTPSHLGWDLAVFILLGSVIELRSRTLLLATLTSGALGISAAIWVLQPDLATYRGLSGLDSALFALLVILGIREARLRRSWRMAVPSLAAGLAFAAKTAGELVAGTSLFVASDPAFVAVPLAHAAGAMVVLAFIPLLAHAKATVPPRQKCPVRSCPT